jgi:hypothetical protein
MAPLVDARDNANTANHINTRIVKCYKSPRYSYYGEAHRYEICKGVYVNYVNCVKYNIIQPEQFHRLPDHEAYDSNCPCFIEAKEKGIRRYYT